MTKDNKTKNASALKTLQKAAVPRSKPVPVEEATSAEADAVRKSAMAETQQASAPAPCAPSPKLTLREEVLQVLKGSLRITVEDGNFTDPNTRTIKVMLGKDCVSQASFNVKARREYEG